MNRVTLIGRWTKKPELKYIASGTPVANATLAVDRPPRNGDDGGAEFINIVIWGKLAELTANHTGKGHQVGIDGRLQTRSFNAQDGSKRYVTEVVAERVEFLARPGGGAKAENVSNSNDLLLDDAALDDLFQID